MSDDPIHSSDATFAVSPDLLQAALALIAPALVRPERLSQPYAWIEHIPFANWLVAQHRPRVLVELGTHTGNSYLAFCQAVAASGIPTRCFAIDTWRGDEHAGRYGEEVFQTLSEYHDQHYSTFSRLVRSTFDDALEHFSDHSIDLLHIDGLHTYEAVAHDYYCWINKVSDRGIILVHDTNVRENEFGVFRVWEEVRSQFPHFEFLHGHGLGVLGVGPNVSPQLKALFAARLGNESCQQVRNTFAQLGRALTLQETLHDERRRRQESVSRYHELRAQYDALAERLETLEEKAHAGHPQSLSATGSPGALVPLAALQPDPRADLNHEILKTLLEHALRETPSLRTRLKIKLAAFVRRARSWAERGGSRTVLFRTVSAVLRASVPTLHRRLRRINSDPKVLFESDWYVHRHQEVAASGIDPFTHYLRFGASQGFDPNPFFDSDWYLAQNPDVAAAGHNPLIHYFNDGAAEGRDPNPFFDSDWYLAQNSDVSGDLNPLAHYLSVGAAEGRDPGPNFDTRWYLASNPDVAATTMRPFEHFLLYGLAEGRKPRNTVVNLQAPRFFRTGPRDQLGHVTNTADVALSSPHSVAISELVPATQPRTDLPAGLCVDVIVPVYRGLAETSRCIDSVLRSRSLNQAFGRLIVVDDCSPDAQIRSYLSGFSDDQGILLLTNPENLGFVASVNRAISAAASNDVVLLNSDTEVCGNWLDRLVSHAYAGPQVGTVTPFSNNATICSYPDIGGKPELPAGLSLQDIDRACSEANEGRAVEMPTGVGFCMLVTRACLDEIGTFDEEAFGKGYGEEVDFCQRALERGWRHMLAGDVFVFHVGETSFADSSTGLKSNAAAVLRDRYPTYEAQVARWVERNPALPLRLAATAAVWKQNGATVVLHLLHAAGGGTEKHVAELTARLEGAARHLILIARREGEGFGFTLLVPEGAARRAIEFASDRMPDVVPFLQSFGISQAHVHHFLEVSSHVATFLRHLGVPYDLSIHDYTAICPRITLMRHQEPYCGEPDEKGCLRCLSQGGHKLGTDILWWRGLGTSMIRDADRVLCPSVDTAERIRRYVPAANIVVVPHEKDLYRPARALVARALKGNQPLRIAVLGIMAEHKGGAYLLDCVEAAARRGVRIRWHVIGEFSQELASRANALGRVLSITGHYDVSELPAMIERVAPHLMLFPQRWPETYSYTLSEAFAAGVPVLVPEIGAFPERTEGVPGCWTYPVNLPAEKLVDEILEIRRQFVAGAPVTSEANMYSGTKSFAVDVDFYRERYLRHAA